MPKEVDHGWAVFNIETDGNQFDFNVALGATVQLFATPTRQMWFSISSAIRRRAACLLPADPGPATRPGLWQHV